ncbi:MAG: chemotaxis protein CheW [Gammaproteobacteria bacterium]|nr:chemotaxis protein CheW [Gammaproteobacteria bacterium]
MGTSVHNTVSLEEYGLTPNDEEQQTQWLLFTLGNESYGVDVLHVQEILQYPEISPVPGSPEYVLGIINLRGEVITVCDIRMMLGLADQAITKETRIVMMELADQKMGILVDNVNKIIKIKASDIDTTTLSEGNRIIQGTWQQKGQLYILLSINELMKGNPD